jgi:hypothetical protein
MKRNLYVIYDRVAEESGPVYEAQNDGIANRRYKALMSEQTHDWFDETDFTLFHVGEIDKTTNIINALPPREVYISLSLLNEEENAESV